MVVTVFSMMGYIFITNFVGISILFLSSYNALAIEPPVKEFQLPETLSSANAMVIDSEGRVWFAEKVGKNISYFDTEKGLFKAFTLPASWGNVGPSNLAYSLKGYIWFTLHRWAESEEDINILGRLDTSDGSFEGYRLSTEVIPEDLVVDDAGIVWFIPSNENKIYRFDPSDSELTGYQIPTKNSSPQGITVDKKGNIWFTETNVNKIGVFNPEKREFLEYLIPTPFANPKDIIVDDKGRVWFTELTRNRIGLLYPVDGIINEAMIPTPQSVPNSISVDSEGNIWFLEYRGNKVGMFNPQEAYFKEYDIPTFNSRPGELVIDKSGGIIWFSETDTEAKRLGMLSIRKVEGENEAAGMIRLAGNTNTDNKEAMEGDVNKGIYLVIALLLLTIAVIGGIAIYSRRGVRR